MYCILLKRHVADDLVLEPETEWRKFLKLVVKRAEYLDQGSTDNKPSGMPRPQRGERPQGGERQRPEQANTDGSSKIGFSARC